MGQQTANDGQELLAKPVGADNVWSDDFAISEVCDFAEAKRQESRVEAANGDPHTVAHPSPAVQSQNVTCAVCSAPLTRGQERCCSMPCSVAWMRRSPNCRDQRGAKNANWKGGFRASVHVLRFKQRNPEKARAHQIVAVAIRLGWLVRPSCCGSCFVDCRPDAHHPNYAEPLSVEWLCRKCHAAADRIRARREALQARPTTAQQAQGDPDVIESVSQFLRAERGRRAVVRHALKSAPPQPRRVGEA